MDSKLSPDRGDLGSMNTSNSAKATAKPESSYSSPKKKLLEAKRQDALIEKEVVRIETEKVVKKVSEELWNGTIRSLLSSPKSNLIIKPEDK